MDVVGRQRSLRPGIDFMVRSMKFPFLNNIRQEYDGHDSPLHCSAVLTMSTECVIAVMFSYVVVVFGTKDRGTQFGSPSSSPDEKIGIKCIIDRLNTPEYLECSICLEFVSVSRYSS
jgi:hypothetical protein